MDDFIFCPFERGQVYKNPDDFLMMVFNVVRFEDEYRVNYVSETGQIGIFSNRDKYIIDNIELVSINNYDRENFVLVPIYATENMINAGDDYSESWGNICSTGEIYTDMIRAYVFEASRDLPKKLLKRQGLGNLNALSEIRKIKGE